MASRDYFTIPTDLDWDERVELLLPADTLVVGGPSLDEDPKNGRWRRLDDGTIYARMTILELRWCLALTDAIRESRLDSLYPAQPRLMD